MAGIEDIKSTTASALHERRWRDLRTGRLCLGLILVPIPTALMLAALAAFDPDVGFEGAIAGAVLLFGAIIWSLLGGWIYLLVVARLRGRIERAECLLLGVALNDLMPVGFLLFSVALSGRAGIKGMFGGMDGTSFLIAGSMLSLLGLVGGCLFWVFGVRPSRGPDVVAVFD